MAIVASGTNGGSMVKNVDRTVAKRRSKQFAKPIDESLSRFNHFDTVVNYTVERLAIVGSP
jgi:hypothetical protein